MPKITEPILTDATGQRIARALESMQGSSGSASLTIGNVTTGDTAAASISNGQLHLTLPRGEAGPAGPGLSDSAKALILTLFEGAAYTTNTMSATLQALRTEWGIPASGGDDPTPPTPSIDETILYALPAETTFTGKDSDIIDTGVKLFASNHDFSITFSADGQACGALKSIFICMRPSDPYPGIELFTYTSNGSIVLRQSLQGVSGSSDSGSYTTDVDAGKAYSIRYVLTYDSTAQKFSFYLLYNDTVAKRVLSNNVGTMALDSVLYLGGFKGMSTKNWTGVLHDFTVYERILPTTEVAAYLGKESV